MTFKLTECNQLVGIAKNHPTSPGKTIKYSCFASDLPLPVASQETRQSPSQPDTQVSWNLRLGSTLSTPCTGMCWHNQRRKTIVVLSLRYRSELTSCFAKLFSSESQSVQDPAHLESILPPQLNYRTKILRMLGIRL